MTEFKKKLLNTLSILKKIPEIIIIGSEVPNILSLSNDIDDSNLFVSQDIDIGIPVKLADNVKFYLTYLEQYYTKSIFEPSVFLPNTEEYLEINFLGIDKRLYNFDEVYIYDNDNLSFMVFGNLSLIESQRIIVDGNELNIAEPISLIFEKLLSERNYIKIERDLYVVALLLKNVSIDYLKNRISEISKKLDKERKLLILDNLILMDSILLKLEKTELIQIKVKEFLRFIKNEFGI
ncbi:MAG TPA: hypothetical protein PKY81_14515 [bacterium]|nr:hypothetical protein [bacterium]HPN32161.1 hypothetical protein [bacterium]